MKISIRGYITSKESELFSDCADRYARNISNKSAKFAISDGVSRSFFPKIWAEILVNNFVNTEGSINDDDKFIEKCQKEWLEEVSKIINDKDKEVKWFTRNAFNSNKPGLATFVNLHFFAEGEGKNLKWKWKANALGDSFLFFVPKEIKDFNLKDDCIKLSSKETDDFDNYPDYLSSIGKKHKGNKKSKESELKEGTFYLMTDALSEWFLKEKAKAIDKIKDWKDQEHFEQFVKDERYSTKLGNDDSAILIIEAVDNKKNEITSSEKNILHINELPDKKDKNNAETGSLIKTLKGHDSSVHSVAFSPDGSRIASGSEDKTIKLWNAETGSLIKTLKGHDDWVHSVAFSPDGSRLASGSYDHTIQLWNAQTGSLINTLKGHHSSVYSLAFSHHGSRLASGSDDKTIQLWDAQTDKLINTLKGHHSSVLSIAFSPDGSRLASGSGDHTIKLWNAQTGDLINTLKGHHSSVYSLAFSHHGSRLASGSYNIIKLWNAQTGDLINTLKGHDFAVFSLAFSPDGNRLASGSSDKTIKLWNAKTESLTLKGHDSSVFSLAFSPDGSRLVSGSSDKTIKLWDISKDTNKLQKDKKGAEKSKKNC